MGEIILQSYINVSLFFDLPHIMPQTINLSSNISQRDVINLSSKVKVQ